MVDGFDKSHFIPWIVFIHGYLWPIPKVSRCTALVVLRLFVNPNLNKDWMVIPVLQVDAQSFGEVGDAIAL